MKNNSCRSDDFTFSFDVEEYEKFLNDFFHKTKPEEPKPKLHKVREGRWFNTTEEYQEFLVKQTKKNKSIRKLINRLPTEDAIIISETTN